MKITRLSPQRRNPERVSVFLDGRFSFGLHQDTITRLGLREGMELGSTDVDELLHQDELRRAKEYALLLLSYRARTEHELHKRLTRKGFRPAVAVEAVDRLKQLKLVDDTKFARDFMADRVKIGHKGKRIAHLELIKLGVSREDARQALDNAPDELEAAREVISKYRSRYARLEPAVRRRRLYAALSRRGFPYDVIKQALNLPEDDD
jgi:regulatory protein